jgi:hypothetical protein
MAKTVHTAPKSQTWQPIRKFPQPAPFNPPKFDPPKASNECAAKVVRDAAGKGGINPKQMVY